MDKKYLSNILLYFVLGSVSVCIIFFVVYHLNFDESTSFSKVPASETTEGVGFEAIGYRFANETVIYGNEEGLLYSALSEGENVGKGGEVCAIYQTDRQTINDLKATNEAIAILNESIKTKDLKTATARLRILAAKVRSDCLAGDAAALTGAQGRITEALLSRMSSAGAVNDIKTALAELKDRKAMLTSAIGSAKERIFSPVSGNYFSGCDGYEELFSGEAAQSLTPARFDELTRTMKAADTSRAAGKIVCGAQWFFAMKTDSENAEALHQNETYTVIFETAGEIEMTLASLTNDPAEGSTLLVFSSRTVPETPVRRCEKATVRASKIKGLIVPTAALRFIKDENGSGTVGVYTVKGNKITFKKVDILAEKNGYYIAQEYTDSEHRDYLMLNDVIITSGKGIKEGYTE